MNQLVTPCAEQAGSSAGIALSDTGNGNVLLPEQFARQP